MNKGVNKKEVEKNYDWTHPLGFLNSFDKAGTIFI